MNKNNHELIDFLDDEISEEYIRRRLGNESLDDVANIDVEIEYESRGLGEYYILELKDEELIEEVKRRKLYPYPYTFDVNADVITLANKIFVDINQDLCVKNRVISLIEQITAKKVWL